MSRVWSRIDAPWSHQGHALVASAKRGGQYVAYQDENGIWMYFHRNGNTRSDVAVATSFSQIRDSLSGAVKES